MPFLYYNIDFRITVADAVQFGVLETVWVENTIEKFSDTAKITLPREFKNAKRNGKDLSIAQKNILEFIQVGDAIKIEMGYNGDLQTEFEGYITNIGAEIPLLIECEDEMYQLKRSDKLSKTFSKVSLKQLMRFIAPNYEIEALDINLGKFMISNATPYEVIEGLKEQYGIRCYFKEKILHAGLAIDMKPQNTHDFVFGRSIRKSSDLKYLTKERRQKKVKAISIQKGTSKRVEYEFGNNVNGEITLHAPVNLNKTELKEWAEKYYNSHVYEGYEGSVDGWCEPRTRAQDSLNLYDPNYEDGHRDGRYFIESVVITGNASDGIKRQNKISFKL